MIRVEIIGPPGVGKTTIYNQLVKVIGGTNIFTPEEIINKEYYSAGKTSLLKQIIKKNIGFNAVPYSFIQEEAVKYVSNDSILSNVVWKMMNESTPFLNTGSLRLRSAYLFMLELGKATIIQRSISQGVCIQNESLLQRSFLINQGAKTEKNKDLMTYIKKIPTPDFVIIIETMNDEVIVKRLASRTKNLLMYKGLSENQLRVMSIDWTSHLRLLVSLLENHGTGVFRINPLDTVQKNAQKIISLLAEIRSN